MASTKKSVKTSLEEKKRRQREASKRWRDRHREEFRLSKQLSRYELIIDEFFEQDNKK